MVRGPSPLSHDCWHFFCPGERDAAIRPMVASKASLNAIANARFRRELACAQWQLEA